MGFLYFLESKIKNTENKIGININVMNSCHTCLEMVESREVWEESDGVRQSVAWRPPVMSSAGATDSNGPGLEGCTAASSLATLNICE